MIEDSSPTYNIYLPLISLIVYIYFFSFSLVCFRIPTRIRCSICIKQNVYFFDASAWLPLVEKKPFVLLISMLFSHQVHDIYADHWPDSGVHAAVIELLVVQLSKEGEQDLDASYGVNGTVDGVGNNSLHVLWVGNRLLALTLCDIFTQLKSQAPLLLLKSKQLSHMDLTIENTALEGYYTYGNWSFASFHTH